MDYWLALGMEYHVARVVHTTLCIVAMFYSNPRFHGAFAVLMLVYQASWAFRQYWTMG